MAAIIRGVTCRGCGLANRIRASPSIACKRSSSRREVAGRVVGGLIVIDDLPEQLDFASAGVHGMARLGYDVRRRPHALVTARVRHDTERTEFVATFDDGDVGLHRIEAASDPQWKRDIAHGIDIELRTELPRGLNRGADEHRQALHALGADDDVDGLRALQQPLTFLLRDASRHRDDRPRALLDAHLPKLTETREEFFFGAFPHAARVDDDDVGVAVVGSGFVASLLEQPRHALGVVHVHLAAVSLDQILSRHCTFRPRRVSLSPFGLPSLSPAWSRFFCSFVLAARRSAPRVASISRALAITAGDTAAPPIIRASSSSRSAALMRVTEVMVRPAFTDLAMR